MMPSLPTLRHSGNLVTRLIRGSRMSWRAERHAATLPADLDAAVMALEGGDRFHRKQGRSTARVRFDAAPGDRPLSVYLKRHYRLPAWDRVRALVHPAGRYSPAAAEWAHLERARALGITVPEVVAVGERIGPWGALQSYLMVAELVDQAPLHEAIPDLAAALDPAEFARLKRALVVEMAATVARLHAAHAFHKDLYLCHFFLPPGGSAARRRRRPAGADRPAPPGGPPLGGGPVAGEGPRAVALLDRRGPRGRRPRPAPVLDALPPPAPAPGPAVRSPPGSGQGRALRQA